jgi:hypothetical protein
VTDILEILKQIGNRFPFAVGEDWFVEAITIPPCGK